MRRVEGIYLFFSSLTLLLLVLFLIGSGRLPSLGLTERIAEVAIELVGNLGYAGLFLLMFLENIVVPIPSEVVIPLAGYLSHRGVFDFWMVMATTTFASLLSSLFIYWLGRSYGRDFLERYGWLLQIKREDLNKAERWFSKYGSLFIFLGRMIPGLRSMISLPAGIGRMNLLWFSILTVIGSLFWNLGLAYVGVVLEQNWILIERTLSKVDSLVVVVTILLLIYLLFIRGKSSEH